MKKSTHHSLYTFYREYYLLATSPTFKNCFPAQRLGARAELYLDAEENSLSGCYCLDCAYSCSESKQNGMLLHLITV